MSKRNAGPQFTATKREMEAIMAIAKRAEALALKIGVKYPRFDAMMDVEACHSNGMPLKLFELLAADDGNFGHDVFGIRRHINRDTGVLQDRFVPRFAAPVTETA